MSLRGMWADVIVCCWDERLDLQVDHLRCMCSVSGCVMICGSDDDPLQILQAERIINLQNISKIKVTRLHIRAQNTRRHTALCREAMG